MARVGRHDNFFELGGDSLLGLRVINRVREWLGETISLVLIFEAPTVAQMAVSLTQQHPAALARNTGEPAEIAPAPATDAAAQKPVEPRPPVLPVEALPRDERNATLAAGSLPPTPVAHAAPNGRGDAAIPAPATVPAGDSQPAAADAFLVRKRPLPPIIPLDRESRRARRPGV